MTIDETKESKKLDKNNDGHICDDELTVLEKARIKRLEDEDLMRDAQRNMAWFSLLGMLLYPFSVVLADYLSLGSAVTALAAMAPTYFVSVAAIVAAFYAKEGYTQLKNKDSE